MNINSIVRRLAPVECERLMNFPDSYLAIDGEKTPDSPIYRGCGNSWGRNNARWVNLRIEKSLRDAGVISGGRTVQYATTCSGVECHTLAVRGQNWNANFYSEIEPFPCKVLAHHYPTVPNLGDMTKVDGTPYDLDVFSGGTPCFAAGTMVLTPSGYVPIETLKIGDKVVSGSGHIRQVEAVGSKMADVGLFKAIGRPEIVCTPNHPWQTVKVKRDNRRKSETYSQIIPDGEFEKTRADESVGRFVCRLPNVLPKMNAPRIPLCYSATKRDIMELAGWYVGDGCIRRYHGLRNNRVVVLSLVSEEKIARFKKRFEGKINFYITKLGHIDISNTKLAEWLIENFGEHADGKRIPYWVYGDVDKDAFIEGYKATDGCDRGTHWKFCSVSKSLAYGIADLFGNASVSFHKTPDKYVIEGRTVSQKDYWVVYVTNRNTIRTKVFEGRYSSRVRSFNTAGQKRTRVYNITVADEHTYIADGLFSFNCQSFSVAGKRHGLGGSTSWDNTSTRSSLVFHWVRIGLEAKAKIMLFENVAGIYSSTEGKDFPWLIHFLNDMGYAVAWRTMDMQWIWVDDAPRAVPQRRRRIWLCAQKGDDWRFPAQMLFERSALLGSLHPNRIVDGRIIRSEEEEAEAAFDLFGGCEPDFSSKSRADWIPFSEMPGNGGDFLTLSDVSLVDFFRKIGKIGYVGGIFDGAASVDNISARLRENIGNAGCAVGGRIVTMKMPEWSAGIQLPDGVDCPKEFNGTVCGLSDVLLPMSDDLLKYILSPRACTGILRRAENRGKKLPEPLERTLHEQIANWAAGAFGDAVAANAEDEKAEAEGGDECEVDEDGNPFGEAGLCAPVQGE